MTSLSRTLPTLRPPRVPLAIAGISAIVLLHIVTLLRYPFPFVDEAWFAARAWAWEQNGASFGLLDRGIFDYNAHGYQVFPFLFTALQAHSLTIAGGVSLVALRGVSLVGGVLLLAALYVIGTHWYDRTVGIGVVIVVALSRPFWLSAHLARPDTIAAAMGYSALALLLTTRHHAFWRAFLCGMLLTIGFEFHPNALIFALPLAVVALPRPDRRQLFAGLSVGGLLGIGVYAAVHILPNIDAYRATMQLVYGVTHTPPLFTFNPRLLAISLVETMRWIPQFYSLALVYPWLAIGVVGGLLWSVRRVRHPSDIQMVRMVLAFVLAVAVLMRSKNNYYAIVLSPALDLLVTVGLIRVWTADYTSTTQRLVQRSVVVGVLGVFSTLLCWWGV